MRRGYNIIIVGVMVLVGCEKPNEGLAQYEQLTDANVPYDPSVVDLNATGQTGWTSSTQTQYDEPVAYGQPAITPQGSSGQVHVVQKKDTLFGLARMYYNDQTQWKKIYEANRDQIPNPNLIKVGMKLVIP